MKTISKQTKNKYCDIYIIHSIIDMKKFNYPFHEKNILLNNTYFSSNNKKIYTISKKNPKN
jgi:hypothetical protein